ncbi:MAG: hypothetical protein WBG43_10715 [Marinifilaceae bacterium]
MKIFNIAFILFFVLSCTPDRYNVVERNISKADIKIIELRAASDRMIVDGKSAMEFNTILYGIKKIKKRYKEQVNELISYNTTTKLDTFIIPRDQYSKDLVKIYYNVDKIVSNNIFYSKGITADKLDFFAKVGDLVSKKITIKMRKGVVNDYKDIVIPVIFHVMNPPSYTSPPMKLDFKTVKAKLDLLNLVFNRKRTSNPNAGTANITFKLAKYDNDGVLLEQEGLDINNYKKTKTSAEILDLMKKTALWDPSKYLNIWIGEINDSFSWSSDGSGSYMVEKPNVILTGKSVIKGIEAKEVSQYKVTDDTKLTDVGIVYNREEFLITESRGMSYTLSKIIGLYFGLNEMKYNSHWDWKKQSNVDNLVEGDTDFCEDTPVYEDAFSIYKKMLDSDTYFTTFNIMANYSQKNSITVNQVDRIREVIDKCPSRWAYKSDWAFTGK